jgi:hypothetical protein
MGLSKIDFKSTDSNKVNFTAVRDSLNVWHIEGDSVSSSVMSGYLGMFNNLSTEDFVDSTVTSFPVPTYTLIFTSPTQQSFINLYKMPNTTPVAYMMQVSGVNQLFKFYEGMAGQIMKKKKDFVPEQKPK